MLRTSWSLSLAVITAFFLSLDTVSCGDNHITAPEYGGTCNQGIQCDAPYQCIEGTCDCPFPGHQFPDYNGIGMPCRSYVGGPCLEEELSFRCVDHAECLNSTSRFFTCQCSEGYIEIAGRTCKIAFGQPCTNFREGECDSAAGLTCRDSVCACQEFQQYDTSARKCRGLIGSLCDPTVEQSCAEATICTPLRGEERRGYCHCYLPGFEQPDRTCKPFKSD